jgi:hypothetical protein
VISIDPTQETDGHCRDRLGFWYGGQLVMSGESTPGDILVVFFSIIMGSDFHMAGFIANPLPLY